MKTATCTVYIDKGHSVPIYEGITPAEALLLTSMHHHNVGGEVVRDIRATKDVVRTDYEEVERLRQKYHKKFIQTCFPGATPSLPKDFAIAKTAGQTVTVPEANLTDSNLTV